MHKHQCRLLVVVALFLRAVTSTAQTQAEKPPEKAKPASTPRQKRGKSQEGSIASPSPEPTYPSAAIELARKGAAILSDKKAGVRSPQPAETPMLERGARRYAFIVANWNYTELPQLQTPRIDAEAMLDVLAANGFILTVHYNLDLDGFRKALEEFLKVLNPTDFALFYYAGHGIEVNQKTMLLPVNFRKLDIDVPDARAYPLIEARQLLTRGGRQALVIVDSCRTSPFSSGTTPTRLISTASVAPESKEGLVFAASQGESAFDGEGWNRSYFSRALTYAFRQGELGLRSAANLARAIVVFSTLAEQRPEVSFSSDFEDAPIAAFRHPNGFAPTPLREQVLFSPERERLAAQETIQRLQRAPSAVGLNFRPASVLTVNQEWIERHHSDTGNWTDEQKKSAIRFLEDSLQLDAVSQSDGALWAELKTGQYSDDTIWFEEELGFRMATLPSLFEAIPPEARKLLKAKDVTTMPVAFRALLGYLDAHNLRTMKWDGLNSTKFPHLANWATTLAQTFDGAADEHQLIQSGTLRSIIQACVAVSTDKGHDCLALIERSRVSSFNERDKAVLSLLFHLAVEHRVAGGRWLAQVLARPAAARTGAFSDALIAISNVRLTAAAWSIQQDWDFKPGYSKMCERLRILEQGFKNDPLDLFATVGSAFCETPMDRQLSGRSTWYTFGLANDDLESAAIQALTDTNGAYLGIRDASPTLENEIMNTPAAPNNDLLDAYKSLQDVAHFEALTGCLPSRRWRELSRRQTQAVNPRTAQELAADYYNRMKDIALSLFDLSAFQLFEELYVRVREGNWESSWMNRERGSKATLSSWGCFVSVMRGDLLDSNEACRDLKTEVNSASERTDEHLNKIAIDNAVAKAYWHAFAGRTGKAEEQLAFLAKTINELRSKAILNKGDVRAEESTLLGVTQLVMRMDGKAADSKVIQAGLIVFFPYIGVGCGMVPEIR